MRSGKLASLAFLVVALPGLSGCASPDNGWAERATQFDQLHDDGWTGDGVRIAILDTGIDLSHPGLRHLDNGDLWDGELRAYRDFVSGGSEVGPRDDHGHGTFIAGVLAGRAPSGPASFASGDAVDGLVPRADLMVGRMCPRGDCSPYVLRAGLQWALDGGADIVSLSIGFEHVEEDSPKAEMLRPLLERAEREGVLVVAAAGNELSGHNLYPAREPTVLAVGDVGLDGQPRHPGLCKDGKPDLLAPGEEIVGPALGRGLVGMAGSSAAVPFVVAAAAVLLEGLQWRPDRIAVVREALESTALPVHDRCPGLLQAEAARLAAGHS